MWEFLKNNAFIIGGLTGSLAAYLLGLIVSYIRREKRLLAYSVRTQSIVRSDRPDLRMEYKGKVVVRLDSYAVVLKNTGNYPLSKLPIHIISPRAGHIIEFDVVVPDGAFFTSEQQSHEEIRINIDLLNPNEISKMGFIVADAKDNNFKVIIRVAGLNVREQDTDGKPLFSTLLLSFDAFGTLITFVGAMLASLLNPYFLKNIIEVIRQIILH